MPFCGWDQKGRKEIDRTVKEEGEEMKMFENP